MGRALKTNEIVTQLDDSQAAKQIVSVLEALSIFARSGGLHGMETKINKLLESIARDCQVLLPADPTALSPVQALTAHIRATTRYHHQMLLTVIDQTGNGPLGKLMCFLETTGNRYIDYSELVGTKVFPKHRLNGIVQANRKQTNSQADQA